MKDSTFRFTMWMIRKFFSMAEVVVTLAFIWLLWKLMFLFPAL